MRSWLVGFLDIGADPTKIRTSWSTSAGRYPFEQREGVEVKGKGVISTWTLGVPAERAYRGTSESPAALPGSRARWLGTATKQTPPAGLLAGEVAGCAR